MLWPWLIVYLAWCFVLMAACRMIDWSDGIMLFFILTILGGVACLVYLSYFFLVYYHALGFVPQ